MRIPLLSWLYEKFVDTGGIDVFDAPNDYSFKKDFDLYFHSALNKHLKKKIQFIPENIYDLHFNVAIRLNLLGVKPCLAVNETVLYLHKLLHFDVVKSGSVGEIARHFDQVARSVVVDNVVDEIHADILKTGGSLEANLEIEDGTKWGMPEPQKPQSIFAKSKPS